MQTFMRKTLIKPSQAAALRTHVVNGADKVNAGRKFPEEWWQQAQPLESMQGALAGNIASSLFL